MAKYRQWSDYLTHSLQKRFDEREIEKQTKESYILQKMMSLQYAAAPSSASGHTNSQK
jgi:hypothetical protein